jgi:hypothetical protein
MYFRGSKRRELAFRAQKRNLDPKKTKINFRAEKIKTSRHFKKCMLKSFVGLKIKKCVAYPQEDFLFIKLITSLRISLLNNCKKDFQFHTESKFFYSKYKIFLHDLLKFHVFGPS